MGDLDKNIHRKDNPYEKIIINPLEKDQKGKDGYPSDSPTDSQIFASLVSFFKKIAAAFGTRGKDTSIAEGHPHLLENILAFQQLLLILASEDQSHNPDFTEQLSESWHNLLSDCNALANTTLVSQETLNKLKFFVSQVENFPPDADHTLGFYFNEYAGKDWIPFPFMHLLQDLHRKHSLEPDSSTLQCWIQLLNEILTSS